MTLENGNEPKSEELEDLLREDESDLDIEEGEEGDENAEKKGEGKEGEKEETEQPSPGDEGEEEEKEEVEKEEPSKERIEEVKEKEEKAPPTLEDVYKNWTEVREKAEEALAIGHYALDEETAEELAMNAETVIPKLMARVYMDAITASMQHIVEALPQLVDSTLQAKDVAARDEEEFFETWRDYPQLREHRDVVHRLASSYRQLHPNASKTEAIRDVGAQAILALQLPVAATGTPEESTPHKPVGARGKAATAVKAAPTNPFEVLSRELEEEPLDLD